MDRKTDRQKDVHGATHPMRIPQRSQCLSIIDKATVASRVGAALLGPRCARCNEVGLQAHVQCVELGEATRCCCRC
jgi:hypothetical protein